METLDAQLYKFLFIMVAGMVTGILIDVFRAWRFLARPRKIMKHVTDVLMVASVCCFLVMIIIHGTWGEMRLYTLVALLCGLGSYFYLASPTSLYLFREVFWLIFWFLGHIVRLVLIPFTWLGSREREEEREEHDEEPKQ